MDFKIGLVVKNKAGKNKNRFFVVVDLNDTFVYICDGKYNTLSKPKKKNLKHLSMSNTVLRPEDIDTNKKIRTALKNFNN